MAMPGVRRHLGGGRRVAIPEVIATSGSKPEGDPEVALGSLCVTHDAARKVPSLRIEVPASVVPNCELDYSTGSFLQLRWKLRSFIFWRPTHRSGRNALDEVREQIQLQFTSAALDHCAARSAAQRNCAVALAARSAAHSAWRTAPEEAEHHQPGGAPPATPAAAKTRRRRVRSRARWASPTHALPSK